jgi:hypothetical protein
MDQMNIVQLLVDVAEAILSALDVAMKDEPKIDTARAEELSAELRDRLKEYQAAQKLLDSE